MGATNKRRSSWVGAGLLWITGQARLQKQNWCVLDPWHRVLVFLNHILKQKVSGIAATVLEHRVEGDLGALLSLVSVHRPVQLNS